MNIIRNPARSRPLSSNVKRLMKMAREAPVNPNVKKVERNFTPTDYAYCDMQGNIFMAAVDRGYDIADFAPIYMNSQLAGVIDYSFSCTDGMENDSISNLLQVPMLVKSPEVIVDVVMWLEEIVSRLSEDESPNTAVLEACMDVHESVETERISRENAGQNEGTLHSGTMGSLNMSEQDMAILTDRYEYAYWLGYIYRCECLLHDESSRMVYGAFNESFMNDTYRQFSEAGIISDSSIAESAIEICRRLDILLIGNLWKQE